MKSVLFTTYVCSTLMFSTYVRAELVMPFAAVADVHESFVDIEDVRPDYVYLDLEIGGYLPTPCNAEPIPVLEQDPSRPDVLLLRLSSPSPTKNCIAMREEFRTVVNLPEVARNAQINIEEKVLYLIKLKGYPFEMQVPGAELMRVPGFVSQ